MNKSEYLDILGKQLSHLSQEERAEVLFDYEEHFHYGLQDGKSEEKIASDLGHPKIIAKQYAVDKKIKQAESSASTSNIIRAVIAVVSLGFVNILFVLVPFIIVVSLILALYVSALGAIVSGVALFFRRIVSPFIPSLVETGLSPLSEALTSIFMVSAGLLLLIGVTRLAKYLYKVTINYLKMNIKMIKD